MYDTINKNRLLTTLSYHTLCHNYKVTVWDTELLGWYTGIYFSYGLRVCMTEILLAQNIWYWTADFVISGLQVAPKFGN